MGQTRNRRDYGEEEESGFLYYWDRVCLADMWYCRRDFAIGSADSRCTGQVDTMSWFELECLILMAEKLGLLFWGGPGLRAYTQ